MAKGMAEAAFDLGGAQEAESELERGPPVASHAAGARVASQSGAKGRSDGRVCTVHAHACRLYVLRLAVSDSCMIHLHKPDAWATVACPHLFMQ